MSDEIEWKPLIKAALEARERAYARYSGYKVGAALATKDGPVFQGCNVENAAYPICLCAERAALGAAVSAGFQAFTALAIATGGDRPGTPCGMCRQALSEFARDLPIMLVTPTGARDEWTLTQLLPGSFGPDMLEETNT